MLLIFTKHLSVGVLFQLFFFLDNKEYDYLDKGSWSEITIPTLNTFMYMGPWRKLLPNTPCEKLASNRRSRTTLCTIPFTEQRKLSLTRIEKWEAPVHN